MNTHMEVNSLGLFFFLKKKRLVSLSFSQKILYCDYKAVDKLKHWLNWSFTLKSFCFTKLVFFNKLKAKIPSRFYTGVTALNNNNMLPHFPATRLILQFGFACVILE